jgi:hypothetical protein
VVERWFGWVWSLKLLTRPSLKFASFSHTFLNRFFLSHQLVRTLSSETEMVPIPLISGRSSKCLRRSIDSV